MKNIRLVVKLLFGFGSLLLLLVVVSGIAWNGVQKLSRCIKEYERKTGNLVGIGEIQESMLKTRIAAKDLYIVHDVSAVSEYRQQTQQTQKHAEEAIQTVKNASRNAKIVTVLQLTREYDSAAEALIQVFRRESQQLQALQAMSHQAQEALKSASDSDTDAETDGQRRQVLADAFVDTQFALLSIQASKSLETITPFTAAATQLREKLAEKPAAAQYKLREYLDAASAYLELVAERQKIYTGRMSTIGAEVSKLLEDVRKNHVEEQTATGHKYLDEGQSVTLYIVIGAVVALLFGSVLSVVIVLSIRRSTQQLLAFIGRLETGDFATELPEASTDEFGQMQSMLGRVSMQLGRLLQDVVSGTKSLSFSSTDLTDLSKRMAVDAAETAAKSNTVAASTEETSVSFQSISVSMEQSTSSINMIAASMEEMNATVTEIAQGATRAKLTTEGAVLQSKDASEKMERLGQSAQQISRVTETITEISEQTNLLALNATIEAARAGEAGKGFAVVANEIKELAKQTAAATVDIKSRIEEMQHTTSETILDISQISAVIVEIDEIVSQISTAVVEQSAASTEIARSIAQSSLGAEEVKENILQSTLVVQAVAKEIARVNEAATSISADSSQVSVSAEDLQHLSERLTASLRMFTLPKERFDVAAVKRAHLQWRTKLESVLRGFQALRPEEVTNHHDCTFGKWYFSTAGQEYAKSPKFQEIYQAIGKHHEQVHSLAKQIVQHVSKNEHNRATDLMRTFERERLELFKKLDDLYRS